MRGARSSSPDPLQPYLSLLERKAPRPLTVDEMARLLGVERFAPKPIRAGLERAVAAGRLRRIGKTRYQWRREVERQPGRRGIGKSGRGRAAAGVVGRYTRVRAGYGFVEPSGHTGEGFGRDVLVPAGMEGGARHGDDVEIEIIRRDPHRRRAVGRVVRVRERANEAVIGTLERHGARWLLVPLNDLDPPLVIDGEPPPADHDGLVALARPSGAAADAPPCGTIERILGVPDDPDVQFAALTYEHGIRTEFPDAVLAEANRLPANPDPSDLAGRRDLRDLPFVTIDGETARDFDDAVCLAPDANGQLRLWVAIADVSRYVAPGTALDAEAAVRGTSVYFPDRAVPMLPERLSTELCSLKPDRDRLVLVAELTFDASGRRHSATCYRAIIRSRARLTYTTVATVLSATDTPALRARRAELGPLLAMLERMLDLMRRLYQLRVRAGSLDLDLPEALLDLSDAGRAVGVRLEQRNDAHRIIEEFMLAANRAVAERLRTDEIPLPYRIHEPPRPDDIDELNELLGAFGFAVEYEGQVKPRNVQQLLTRLEAHPLCRVLSRQVLRALRQARYSTHNVGHFGLAFPIYCHFTSPIRRYPDLLVHRQLGCLLDGESERARSEPERLEAHCAQSSTAERKAMDAERAMVDLKKCEFMMDHLLEPEPGAVVSVTAAGLFVELDAFPIEGLLRIDDLPGDRWQYLEEERALKGLRTRQRFRLGDRVVVEATNVSLRRRQIDFTLVRRVEGEKEIHHRGHTGSRKKTRKRA